MVILSLRITDISKEINSEDGSIICHIIINDGSSVLSIVYAVCKEDLEITRVEREIDNAG